jgi:hypothetical protein
LKTGETLTVPCAADALIHNGYTNQVFPLSRADIAIAFYYRPWPITFLRSHRLFRFVARLGPNGEILGWDKEPASILERDFDESMDGRRTSGLKEF